MTAAALALLTSVLYGVSNFIGPRISRDLPVFAVLISGQVVALAVATALAFALSGGFLSGPGTAAALVAGVGNAVGLYGFYRAASEGPLSIVAPIGALGAVVPVVGAVAAGEEPGAVRVTGIVLALAGVALASRRSGARPPAPVAPAPLPIAPVPVAPVAAPAPAGPVQRPVAWAAVAALGFGTFLSFIPPAAASDPLWAVSISRISVVGVLVGIAAAGGSAIRVPAAALPRVALPGLLLFAGTLAYAAASRLGDVSVVSVLASCNPVVTVGLAFLLLRERLSRGQSVGVGLALVGVVLVSAR